MLVKFTNLQFKLATAALSITAVVGITGQAQAITFTGTSSGSWGLPTNPSRSTFLSNQNGGINNRLTWGNPGAGSFTNFVQYDSVGFSASKDSLFNLGNLSYRNGATSDTFDGDFPLSVALSLSNPLSTTETFDFSFNIFNTPNNTGNPVLDGDRLRFSTAGASSQMFSYQGVDYTLELVGFSSDGGNTVVSEFNAPEESTARASLFGKLTAVEPPAKTPEPASVVSLSLLGIYGAARRKGSKLKAVKVAVSSK
ncbi:MULTISPECIES: choice-of-anchor K domain-containing protein [Cyanophyceae]|uniref:choice-of-anchor K domain-containing protein n=1 Tax=Cyanophyceae TaxID=3028117 RepID=UPI001689D1F0|nr:choice-of-anchor K domain-containing protein [Trichocoleus sp. FACHB-40]MBD2004374.1 choice-of-anchor K domain-containing protein [Trichocoleus sp. FACHB-40]